MGKLINKYREKFKKVALIRWLYIRLRYTCKLILNAVPMMFAKINLILRLFIYADQQTLLEYKILLNGNKLYRKNLKKRKNEYYLRRQLHRIEKGLIQEDRKKEFGLEYILPSVQILINMLKSTGQNNTFLIYAQEILLKYFNVTESHNSKYRKAKEKFESLNYTPIKKHLPRKYVKKKQKYFTFDDLVLSRKSIRQFLEKNIPNEIIEKALKLASNAPSGCNRQPYRFIVIKKKKFVDKFSSFPIGGGGNSFGAPALVFVIGDQSVAPQIDSSHVAYVDASFAAMIFDLALENMGVSSCFMNWPHIYELNKKAIKELKLKPHELIVTCIAVGYAKENVTCAFSLRKEVKDILEYYEE
jgi:nitroreductase